MQDFSAHLQKTEILLGHKFKNPSILLEALTHSSFSNELSQSPEKKLANNERLEFLGDAVIGLVIGETLMQIFPDAPEGKLSRWRSHLVSRKTLAEIATTLKLGEHLLLGKGERQTGGGEKRSILAGTFESLVGGLYLDAQLEKTSQFIVSSFSPYLEALKRGELTIELSDCKTYLQEQTQLIFKTTPVYRLVEAWGAEHEKQFRVEIVIHNSVMATAEGKSKKEAEQNAAYLAISVMEKKNGKPSL